MMFSQHLPLMAALLGAFFVRGLKAQTPVASKPPLGSGVFDWNALEVKPTKVGARRDVFDAPTATLSNLECHITTLNPGEVPHAAHRHVDEERPAGPGAVIFLASNELHGLRNAGATPATYYVVRFVPHDLPRPATATQ